MCLYPCYNVPAKESVFWVACNSGWEQREETVSITGFLNIAVLAMWFNKYIAFWDEEWGAREGRLEGGRIYENAGGPFSTDQKLNLIFF